MAKEKNNNMAPKRKVIRNDERTNRFVKVSYDLIDRGKYLTPVAKWLYVVLRSFKNEKKDSTFPSYKTIGEKGGLSKNAVAKGLAELERYGYITRLKDKGRVNWYTFHYPELVDPESSEPIGDQICPTKEEAKRYASSLIRGKNKSK